MKLKVVVVDLEISTRAKRLALRIGLPVAALGVATVAYASVPVTFTAGGTLHAADLNTNFSALDTRVTTLENSDATSASVAALQANVTSLQTSVTALQTQAGTLQTSVSTLNANAAVVAGLAAPRYVEVGVNANGTIFTSGGNVPAPTVTQTMTGGYNFVFPATEFPSGFAAFVSPGLTPFASSPNIEALTITGFSEDYMGNGTFYVEVANEAGTLTNGPFSVLLIGK
ncbi:MAG TPA: hypothetical protein VGL81_25595 [Polyangiaceae bacterium]|jgi:hypothetical protein